MREFEKVSTGSPYIHSWCLRSAQSPQIAIRVFSLTSEAPLSNLPASQVLLVDGRRIRGRLSEVRLGDHDPTDGRTGSESRSRSGIRGRRRQGSQLEGRLQPEGVGHLDVVAESHGCVETLRSDQGSAAGEVFLETKKERRGSEDIRVP